MTWTPGRSWDRELLPAQSPQRRSAMDTRITTSNSAAFGAVPGCEAEDGAAEAGAGPPPVCEGSERVPLPGGMPWAMAR